MISESHVETLEARFAQAPEIGFRGRTISEYRTIKHWVGDRINWDQCSVLDFGCGTGIAAASIALRHPSSQVFGVDIVPTDADGLSTLFLQQTGLLLPTNLVFLDKFPGETTTAEYDIVYAWSVFEHVREEALENVFRAIKSKLKENGVFFLQIDPLYFSPRGSHLYGFIKQPWHHLNKSIDEIREIICPDKAGPGNSNAWKQFLELNRLTGRQIINYAKQAGLRLLREQFVTVDLEPPTNLTDIYKLDVLTTSSLYALFD